MWKATALFVLLLAGTASAQDGSRGPIVLIQDGSTDDYMCSVLLAKFPRFAMEVCVIGDAVVPQNMHAASKLHKLLETANPDTMGTVDLSLSRTRAYNPFPWSYRGDVIKFLQLDQFSTVESNQTWPFADGDAKLRQLLHDNRDVTVVLVSGATPLANVIEKEPCLMRSISRILWMAGAVDVAGNLDTNQHPWDSPKAEWNVFTDPFAADVLLRAIQRSPHMEFLLFPLDIADQTPLTQEFFDVLEEAVATTPENDPKYGLRKLILEAYSLVRDQPFYRLWDTLAAGYLLWPELYAAPKTKNLEVSITDVDQGGLLECTRPGVGGCATVKYFTNFVDEAARLQFIKNVAEA